METTWPSLNCMSISGVGLGDSNVNVTLSESCSPQKLPLSRFDEVTDPIFLPMKLNERSTLSLKLDQVGRLKEASWNN